MKILLDEMLSALIAERLRERGHDAEAVDERPELRGLTDPELFARTQREQRAIATYNRDDFLALDRLYRSEGRNHHGIILVNPRRFLQRKDRVGHLIAALGAFIEAESPYPGFVHWLR